MGESLDILNWWRTEADLPESAPSTPGISLPSSVELDEIKGVSVVVTRFRGAAWQPGESDRAARRALDMFSSLESATPARIREFVKAHGPLYFGRGGEVSGVLQSIDPLIEPVSAYLEHAALAAAIVRGAKAAVSGQPLLPQDSSTFNRFISKSFPAPGGAAWTLLPGGGSAMYTALIIENLRYADRPATPEEEAAARAALVMTAVNWWIDVRPIRPQLAWHSGEQRVTWTSGLWGAIGLQLITQVQRERRSLICANCGRLVRRAADGRKRKIGQHVWCKREDCQRAAAAAHKRASRERRKKDGA